MQAGCSGLFEERLQGMAKAPNPAIRWTVRLAPGLALLAFLGTSAHARDAGITVMSDQLRTAPLSAAAALALAEDGEPPARISFGRAADIEGIPIDYSRYRPPPKPGELAKGAVKGAAKPGSAGYAFAGSFAWPSRLPLAGYSLTSRFGGRYHPILGALRMHSGVDLAAPAGSPIKAPSAGVVTFAQWYGGYGLFVVVDHGAGMETRYGHLGQVAVTPGQQIKPGQVLGYVGSTGLSTGPHLHYEMRLNGQAVDPLANTRSR